MRNPKISEKASGKAVRQDAKAVSPAAYNGQSKVKIYNPETDQKMQIFFSADLVDSTAFKQRYSEDSQKWASAFDDFFADFHRQFIACFTEVARDRQKPAVEFALWKLLGDEMLFTAPIQEPKEAAFFTMAFCRAIKRYDDLMAGSETAKLRPKGAAWTAGFPIRNYEMQPSEQSSRKRNDGIPLSHAMPTDYIGPDIDIGFRLNHVSRAGRVAISLDLADILTRRADLGPFDFRHVGWGELKGVFEGKPYPVIWVCESEAGHPIELPWQEHLCPYSKRANAPDNKSVRLTAQIQQLCNDVRKSLPELNLFKPYFSLQETHVPESHLEWWEKRKKEAEEQQVAENLNASDVFGDSLEMLEVVGGDETPRSKLRLPQNATPGKNPTAKKPARKAVSKPVTKTPPKTARKITRTPRKKNNG